MKYILDISKKNFGRFFKDKKIRFYYIFIGMLVLVSTSILAYKITDKTYVYNIGDIADTDIRIQKDIYYIKEAETEVEKQRTVQTARLVFDKSSDVLEENLKYTDMIFDNVIETKEAYPALKSDDINFQLGELKARLPKSMHFSDHILLSLLSYDNPRELKKAVTRIIIYLYDYKGLGMLDIEYSNPLNLENKTITIRNEDSSDVNDEVLRAARRSCNCGQHKVTAEFDLLLSRTVPAPGHAEFSCNNRQGEPASQPFIQRR